MINTTKKRKRILRSILSRLCFFRNRRKRPHKTKKPFKRKTLPPLFTLKSRNKPLIKQRPEHSCFNFKIRLNNRPGPSYIRLRRPHTDCRWSIQRLYRKSSSSKPPQQKSKHRNRFYGLPASGKPVLRISGEKINVKIPKIKCIF